MAMTPQYALAHVFFPNLIKTKGVATVVGVIERKEKFFFDVLWGQAHVEHSPFLTSQLRDAYRIGVVSLPAPKEMGEAHFIGLVVKNGDPQFARYFMLEHDFVLATQTIRTILSEREGQKHIKRGDGPARTGNNEADAAAFVDAFMALIVPASKN